MKIIDILNQKKFSLSIEVFPPKTITSMESVKYATEEIGKLKPSFMSVTYGAGGGTSDFTIEIAKNLMEKNKVPLLTHLTCVSSSRKMVTQKIREIREAGIENVLALRGDIPNGMDNSELKWDYCHAVELIRQLKETEPDLCVGAACYPEVHPESKSQREDIFYLKEKVEAGVDFLTTQMVFDNNLFFNFLYKIREAGINVPVIPGIMPITNGNQLKQAISLSASHVPYRFKSLVDKFGTNPAAMSDAGIAYATDQIIDLFANDICNVHIYSMNKPEVAKGIMNNLANILGNPVNG